MKIVNTEDRENNTINRNRNTRKRARFKGEMITLVVYTLNLRFHEYILVELSSKKLDIQNSGYDRG